MAETGIDLSVAANNPLFLLAAIRYAIEQQSGDAVIAANVRLYLRALERTGQWAGQMPLPTSGDGVLLVPEGDGELAEAIDELAAELRAESKSPPGSSRLSRHSRNVVVAYRVAQGEEGTWL